MQQLIVISDQSDQKIYTRFIALTCYYCSLYHTVAQAIEQEEAQEEQRVQSITEIMKNPSKVILLKV